MKHTLPLETRVSFEGDGQIYVVDNYQDLLGPCPPNCTIDHDCYTEPYINVRVQHWTAMPLSKLRHVFDDSGKGWKVSYSTLILREPNG